MAKKHKEPPSITAYYRYTSIGDFGSSRRLTGPCRVAVFCLFTILTPVVLLITPLYIRYNVYGQAVYFVGESDLIPIDRQVSTFWCEGQDLVMNASFNAYLLRDQPENSEDLQRVELDKHMKLADDSLEYWGFYLLGGSKVTLSVCSRFGGARLMVVKGTRNLKHCALVEPPNEEEPWDDVSAQRGEKIEVTFEGGEQTDQKLEEKQLTSSTKQTSTTTSTTMKSLATNRTSQSSTSRPLRTRTRLRGRKQSALPSESQEIHENLKVRRHKHTQTIPKVFDRKRKRFVETEPEKDVDPDLIWSSDEERSKKSNENENSNEIYEEDAAEVDEPPNPVGIEPNDNKIVRKKLHYIRNDLVNDEVIDEDDIRSSGASFAKNLWSCYGEDTVFTQTFSPSQRCQSQDAMLKHALRMRTVHEIASSGYYYYIFYSDNDIVLNDIFAKFTIEKVVYSFPNNISSCRNVTNCNLNLTFLSSEKVLLEVPLQDGVSDEDASTQMVLTSTCRPRLGVYFIFPVLILFSILCCAFI